MPGILTAIAAVITALTGLLVAIQQAGWFDHHPRSAPEIGTSKSQPETSAPQSAGEAQASTGSRNDSQSPALPLPQDVRIRSGEAVFELLSAHLEHDSPDRNTLLLTVRMTNNGSNPTNFWSASFRLVVDGVLRAPTTNLNELIAPHSSSDAKLEFEVPSNVSEVGLQMGEVGEGKPAIPISLR